MTIWGVETHGVFLESLAADFSQEAINQWTILPQQEAG